MEPLGWAKGLVADFGKSWGVLTPVQLSLRYAALMTVDTKCTRAWLPGNPS